MRMSVRVRKHWVEWAMVKAGRRAQAQEEAENAAAMAAQQQTVQKAKSSFTQSSYSGQTTGVWG